MKTKTVMVESKVYGDDTATSVNVDMAQLDQDLNAAIEQLAEEGYEVMTITPITAGTGAWKVDTINPKNFMNRIFSKDTTGNAVYSYGYGFSYTQGFVILAKQLPEKMASES